MQLFTSFSLDFHIDEEDIHNKLLADLITGYFGKNDKEKGNYVRWKMHFRKFCLLPTQQGCSVMENFDYLERIGLLAAGKYDTLENIFRFVDERALRNIKHASQMINAIKSTSSDARGICPYITILSFLFDVHVYYARIKEFLMQIFNNITKLIKDF